MKKIRSITLILLVIVLSCEDDSNINTQKNTYHDDISDITHINNSFYSQTTIYLEMQVIKLI